MKCMPFWKGCNRNVDYLDRSHRGLNQIPVELLRYATCLEELLLDGNLIADLPRVHCDPVQLLRTRPHHGDSENRVLYGGMHTIGNGQFWGDVLAHADTCPQWILSLNLIR